MSPVVRIICYIVGCISFCGSAYSLKALRHAIREDDQDNIIMGSLCLTACVFMTIVLYNIVAFGNWL